MSSRKGNIESKLRTRIVRNSKNSGGGNKKVETTTSTRKVTSILNANKWIILKIL